MFYALVERAFALEKQGKKLIKLHIGETNLPTPTCAAQAAAKALARGHSDYGPAAGLPFLRERLARREDCAPENVVVGPGSKHLIFALMSVLGRPGAKVAVPMPAYPAYSLIARQLGMQAVELHTTLESGWQFDPAALEGALLATVSNPVNPTSTIYPTALLSRAAERMQANGGYLILDEAYRGLAFEPIASVEHPAALRVRSFSKEFNMEGWRLGYAVVPKDIARELVRFNQNQRDLRPRLRPGGRGGLPGRGGGHPRTPPRPLARALLGRAEGPLRPRLHLRPPRRRDVRVPHPPGAEGLGGARPRAARSRRGRGAGERLRPISRLRPHLRQPGRRRPGAGRGGAAPGGRGRGQPALVFIAPMRGMA